MTKRAAIIAAVLALHVTSAQAEDRNLSGRAEFLFNARQFQLPPHPPMPRGMPQSLPLRRRPAIPIALHQRV